MTAKTSQKLANALRNAGLEELAVRAEADEFHDFLSPHTFPEMMLADLLADAIRDETLLEGTRMDAGSIRKRLINGDFDADEDESEEWAASPEGQAVFREFKP
jgi:hypothetical protein